MSIKHQNDSEHENHGSCSCGSGHCHENDHEHGHDHGHEEQAGCSCGHEHNEPENIPLFVLRLVVAAAITAVATIVAMPGWASFSLYIIAYLLSGYQVLVSAFKNIGKSTLFDENFLMTVATIGAFALGEYVEGVAVMLFFGVGEALQMYAVKRSKKSIQKLMDIRPEFANLLKDGKETRVSPSDVQVGEKIIVRTGQRVPLDGIVVSGSAYLDTSALTGESMPQSVEAGVEVLSGSINTSGLLELEVIRGFEQSAVSRILELVQNASEKKAAQEKLITRFAKVYTPIVVLLAALTAVIPPLLGFGDFSVWVYRALTFLVISCPCALVVSIPITFFAGIGSASKRGVLVKGGNYLEILSKVDTVVFDKTGTLTHGSFSVQSVNPANKISKTELLQLAAIAEQNSCHPIAASIVLHCKNENIDFKSDNQTYQEMAGMGVEVTSNLGKILAGNDKLMQNNNIEYQKSSHHGAIVYIAKDGKYAGCIVVADNIKEHAKNSIKRLKTQGIKNIVMLTGDNADSAKRVADQLEIGNYFANLLPEGKTNQLEKLMDAPHDGAIIFVGDGINDAPVMAASDAGVAMGALGSEAAIEASDIVLTGDNLNSLCDAIDISRRTLKIAKQNIVFSLGIKIVLIIAGFAGFTNMWLAIFADVGVALLAILNALRAMSYKQKGINTHERESIRENKLDA